MHQDKIALPKQRNNSIKQSRCTCYCDGSVPLMWFGQLWLCQTPSPLTQISVDYHAVVQLLQIRLFVMFTLEVQICM